MTSGVKIFDEPKDVSLALGRRPRQRGKAGRRALDAPLPFVLATAPPSPAPFGAERFTAWLLRAALSSFPVGFFAMCILT